MMFVRRKKYDLLVEKKQAYMLAFLNLQAAAEKIVDSVTPQTTEREFTEAIQYLESMRAKNEQQLSWHLDEIFRKRNGL